MLLIYIVKSGESIVGAIEERKNLRTKEKIHGRFRYGYFVMVNQTVMATYNFCSDDFNLGAT
jgi:hypothetical protein